jgi:hypothetical protein
LSGHIIGQKCLRKWVKHWDRESALRVCTLCNKGFDVTVLGDEPLEDKVLWPGFEPTPDGVDPSAGNFQVLILDRVIHIKRCKEVVRESRHQDFHAVKSPWWMKVLKSNTALGAGLHETIDKGEIRIEKLLAKFSLS